MQAAIHGNNVILKNNGTKVCTITADNALKLAAGLKQAVAQIAQEAIAAQEAALEQSRNLLASAN